MLEAAYPWLSITVKEALFAAMFSTLFSARDELSSTNVWLQADLPLPIITPLASSVTSLERGVAILWATKLKLS